MPAREMPHPQFGTATNVAAILKCNAPYVCVCCVCMCEETQKKHCGSQDPEQLLPLLMLIFDSGDREGMAQNLFLHTAFLSEQCSQD